jgi:hypothetical protein
VLDARLRERLRQIVQVRLQHYLVDLRQGQVAKPCQNVVLDFAFANRCRLPSPCAAFAQREEAVAGKPSEGDNALVRSRLGCSTGLLREDFLERVLCLVLGHL